MRSRFSSRRRRSTRMHSSLHSRGFRSSRRAPIRINGQPVQGTIGIVAILFLVFFIMSFFAIFFITLFASDVMFDILPFIFPLPFVFMVLFFITSVIGTVKGTLQSQKNGGGVTSFYASSLRQLLETIQLPFEAIPSKDKFGPTFITTYDRDKILIKVLPGKVTYGSEVMQAIAQHMNDVMARQAWVIQEPPTFLESDNNFARFYNIELFNLAQFQAKITTIQNQQKPPGPLPDVP